MPSAARTLHACLNSAMTAPIFPPVPSPVDVTDEAAFPNIAEGRRHLASLSPERRAELERTWA